MKTLFSKVLTLFVLFAFVFPASAQKVRQARKGDIASQYTLLTQRYRMACAVARR